MSWIDLFNQDNEELSNAGLRTPTRPAELQFMYNLVLKGMRLNPDRDFRFLECGTLTGKLTLLAGMAIRRVERAGCSKRGKVITVDNQAEGKNYESVVERVNHFDLSDTIEVVNSDDVAYIESLEDRSIHLAYVDSWHAYQHVKAVLDVLPAKMSRLSLLTGHDYCWAQYGVIQAVEQYKDAHKEDWIGFGVSDRIWWTLMQ